MKSVVLESPYTLSNLETPEPKRAEGQALVRVHRVGICGTDLHAIRGDQPFFTYPRVLGHELAVEILEIDSRVDGLEVGDLCAVEPYLNCGQCGACKRGLGNCCEELKVIGVHIDGGMAPALALPADKLHVANDLNVETIALVETLAIGNHAVARSQVSAADQVLVVGMGPIGLGVAAFAKLSGARVVAVDADATRLAFAQKTIGLDHAIPASAELPHVLRDTLGELPRLVFDATGHPASMEAAFDYVAHAGTIVFVGLTKARISFDNPTFHKKELTVKASRNALPKDFFTVIEAMRAGRINVGSWVDRRLALEDLPEHISELVSPEARGIKTMLSLDTSGAFNA